MTQSHQKTALSAEFCGWHFCHEVLVELRGVEPLSKSCLTFRRLQFSPLLDQMAGMRTGDPLAKSACMFFGLLLTGFRSHLIRLITQLAEND